MTAVLLAALLLAWIVMAPLTLRLQLAWCGGFSGRAELTVWGLHLPLSFRMGKTARGGHRLLFQGKRLDRPEKPAPPPGQALTVLRALTRMDAGRHLVLRHVKLSGLQVQARLSLWDAAGTALAAGGAAVLVSILEEVGARPMHLSVEPDFWSRKSRLEAAGALSLRLGTILAAAALLLTALQREKAAQHMHNDQARRSA